MLHHRHHIQTLSSHTVIVSFLYKTLDLFSLEDVLAEEEGRGEEAKEVLTLDTGRSYVTWHIHIYSVACVCAAYVQRVCAAYVQSMYSVCVQRITVRPE